MSDPALILVAELHGRAGLRGELRTLLSELADGANGEPECAGFRVLGADEEGEFVLFSSWISEQGLRAHYETPHYRYYREQVGPMLARPSDVLLHHISSTAHARDPDPPDPGELG